MEETLLDEIFWDRDQGVLRCLTKGERQVMDQIELVHNIRNKKLRKKINTFIDLAMEDLLSREAERLKKYYKQGFKDGVSLIMECKS